MDCRSAHIAAFDRACNDYATGKIDKSSKLGNKINRHVTLLITLGDSWVSTSDHLMVKLGKILPRSSLMTLLKDKRSRADVTDLELLWEILNREEQCDRYVQDFSDGNSKNSKNQQKKNNYQKQFHKPQGNSCSSPTQQDHHTAERSEAGKVEIILICCLKSRPRIILAYSVVVSILATSALRPSP